MQSRGFLCRSSTCALHPQLSKKEYDSVWVSSNGFISFDPNAEPTNPYYSRSIPNTDAPNTFAAPFWRDLDPSRGGSITYGVVNHPPAGNAECFVISWNNIPNKNWPYNPQTFQVVIEDAPERSLRHRQSRIWFQYTSVICSISWTQQNNSA